MSYLVHTNQCCDIIHTGLEPFINLFKQLKATRLVKEINDIWSMVEEQVAKFLHIIEHNVKNRSVHFSSIIMGQLLANISIMFWMQF